MPADYVRVKAYLLDADQRPTGKTLIGLQAFVENFTLHLEKENMVLATRENQGGE